jgi:PPOX class probable F420-dependent enzyme
VATAPLTFSAEARALLQGAEPAVLSTLDADGRPRSWVMWAGLDGDEIVMTTRPHRGQARDVLRDPRAVVLVYDRRVPTRYVEVRGEARIDSGDGDEIAARIVRQYLGADAPPREGPRVVLRLRPTSVTFKDWE